MAHFRVSFGVAARTAGHSAAKRAAYQMCMRGHGIDGTDHDFRHKARQHRGTEILTPKDAPAWTQDSAEIWARAARSEKRVDAQECRLLEIAIPRSVPQELHAEFVRNAFQPLTDAGMIVQLDRHRERAQDGGWNDHAHGMATLREIDSNTETGFSAKKAREWNTLFRDEDARTMRGLVADRCNQFFIDHGIDARVDARTLEAQGLDRDPEPTIPHWKFEAQRNGRDQPEVVALGDYRAARAEAEAAAKDKLKTEAQENVRHDIDITTRPHQPAEQAAIIPEAEPDVELGGFAHDPTHDSRELARPVEGVRRSRTVAGELRGVPSGTDIRQPVAAVGLAGAEEGREQNRRAGGGHREGPGRAETDPRRASPDSLDAGRNRAQAARLEIALQGHSSALQRIREKTAELMGPADLATQRKAAASAVWKESRERVERVLSTEPHKDPASRSVKNVADELSELHRSKFEDFRSQAAAARDHAAAVIKNLGILDRVAAFLTVTTPAMREAELAQKKADEARIRFETEADGYDSDRRDARERAPGVAKLRQEQHDAWERRPEVKRALEEKLANEAIAGSPELKKLAEHDLKRAQQEALKRITQEQADEIARQHRSTARAPSAASPTPGPAPRFR